MVLKKKHLFGSLKNHLNEQECYIFRNLPQNLRKPFLESIKNRIEKSSKDPLTGLYNYGAREEDLQRMKSLADRKDGTFSYITLDFDKFKSLNDTYGHDIGDKVLKGASGIIVDNIRREDIAYRQGGEELSLLMYGINLRGANLAGEKIRNAILNNIAVYNSEDGGNDVVVGCNNVNDLKRKGKIVRDISVSVGVSNYNWSNSGIEAILKQADEALYHAKEFGRNRVVYYDFKDNKYRQFK